MKKIGFSGLETALLKSTNEEDALDQYLAFSNLSTNQVSNYGEVLKYGLAISDAFNMNGLENSYFHIGGYATLFHLINSIGIESIWNWRGSHDLDIVMMQHGGSNILKNYFEVNSFKSPSLKSKEKLEVFDLESSSKVEVDFYLPQKEIINIDGNKISQNFINELDTPEIFGIKVNIPKIHDLLSLKLEVVCSGSGLPREKDMGDILNLLGCLEHNEGFKRKYSTIVEEIDYLKEKIGTRHISQLKKVLEYHNSNPIKYVLNTPSRELRNEIKRIR